MLETGCTKKAPDIYDDNTKIINNNLAESKTDKIQYIHNGKGTCIMAKKNIIGQDIYKNNLSILMLQLIDRFLKIC